MVCQELDSEEVELGAGQIVHPVDPTEGLEWVAAQYLKGKEGKCWQERDNEGKRNNNWAESKSTEEDHKRKEHPKA